MRLKNAKYNKYCNLWGMCFVFFLLFLVSTGYGLLVCCFIFNFVLVLGLVSFSEIILDICEQILFLQVFCVVNAAE